MQLSQHARQFVGRHMEQRRIRKYAVKALIWKVKTKEILLPYLASGDSVGRGDKASRTVQSNGPVTKLGQGLQVASRSAAKVEDRERWLAFDMPQKCCYVLADVMILRTGAKFLRPVLVVRERPGGNLVYILRLKWISLGHDVPEMESGALWQRMSQLHY